MQGFLAASIGGAGNTEKVHQLFCYSERSEESLFLCVAQTSERFLAPLGMTGAKIFQQAGTA
jgi:hypothetical protein